MADVQHEPDSALTQPVRFGLPSLLLLPLFVSPMFLSAVFVRAELEHGKQSASAFFNLLACTVIYAAIFTARSRHRVYRSGGPGPRHALPAAWTGAWNGVLFMAQVVVPWFIAMIIAQAQRFDLSLFDYVRMSFATVLTMVGLFGVFLGAFGGSAVGLWFEWRYRRGATGRD
ncbi:MAG TPA: hypothetical protein PK867_21250 [Pirellulales bacterium]|nr:hypothetical protein [Pirellulales bacterium]